MALNTMKNSGLLHASRLIAANGSTKKHAPRLRKKILPGSLTKMLFFSWLAVTVFGAAYEMYWDDRLAHENTLRLEAEQASDPDGGLTPEFNLELKQEWNKAHPNDPWH